MTTLIDPVPRTLFPATGNRFRAAATAIGRLCHAFAGHLMRRYVRQALRSVSDRRLTKAGVRRCGIDARVGGPIPHSR
jgi:uncharacterized protein YjiS (DUF1127 family)